MMSRASLVLLLTLSLSAAAARADSDAEPDKAPKPTLLEQSLRILHLHHAPKAKSGEAVEVHDGMEIHLGIDPMPFSLSTTHQVKATVSLHNRSRRYIHLDFPTTQRIEVLVRNSSGKIVNTWSEDQSFTNDPASVTINPGERLEYSASVATREMTAGQQYSIEVSIPAYPEIKAAQKVTPAK